MSSLTDYEQRGHFLRDVGRDRSVGECDVPTNMCEIDRIDAGAPEQRRSPRACDSEPSPYGALRSRCPPAMRRIRPSSGCPSGSGWGAVREVSGFSDRAQPSAAQGYTSISQSTTDELPLNV